MATVQLWQILGTVTGGFVSEFRPQMSLSLGTSEISPVSMFVSLGATLRWGTSHACVNQFAAHAR
jgi:hypothetical protein